MANALYDKGRNCFLSGSPAAIDWDTHTMRIFIIDSATYTADLANHDFLDDVAVGSRKGNNGNTSRTDGAQITSPDATDGVADGADTTLTSVTSGNSYEYILCYRDDGSAETTSPLCFLLDTATGLPVSPNGGNINVVWDSGANKIFKL